MFIKTFSNWLIPPHCLLCDESILEAHHLCNTCWKKINFITKPFCSLCGYPLPIENKLSTCETCISKRPIFEYARSIFLYEGAGKKLILRFKHADTTDFAPLFSHLLFNHAKDCFNNIDYLISVPLHWIRFMKRRYNQAALLCLSLRNLDPKLPPYAPYFLRRNKKTESQGHKNAEERKLNLENAFIAPKRYQKRLQGKSILLIDDVMTSGATVEECSRVLYAAGCANVRVLTLARVLLKNGSGISIGKDDE